MDLELKEYLDGKFAGVDRQFAQVHEKFADVDRQFAQVYQKFADIDRKFENLHADMESMEARLKAYTDERCEKVETSLLTAFHTWAQTYEVRARATSAMLAGVDERLGLIEERVAALERKTYPRAS